LVFDFLRSHSRLKSSTKQTLKLLVLNCNSTPPHDRFIQKAFHIAVMRLKLPCFTNRKYNAVSD